MMSKGRVAALAGSYFLFASVIVVAIVIASSPSRAAEADRLTATARYLAGMLPTGDAERSEIADEPVWRRHMTIMNEAFQRLETKTLSKLRSWSAQTMPDKPASMLYPFSGPDFLFAAAVQPDAEAYVLVGLEPVGAVPVPVERLRGRRTTALREIRHSLRAVLEYSFFRTRDMKEEFSENTIGGVMPLMFVFLARSGFDIMNATPLWLSANGLLSTVRPDGRGVVHGLRIAFKKSGAAPDARHSQVLYYFQGDLSNNGFKSNGVARFASTLGRPLVFVKSASYLMHLNAFTRVREMLIERAQIIVQDDSGVPLRSLPTATFSIQPFGTYLGPVDVFPDRYQKDMLRLFAGGRAKPLPFGIGYRWRNRESNLLIATRKPEQATAVARD